MPEYPGEPAIIWIRPFLTNDDGFIRGQDLFLMSLID